MGDLAKIGGKGSRVFGMKCNERTAIHMGPTSRSQASKLAGARDLLLLSGTLLQGFQ